MTKSVLTDEQRLFFEANGYLVIPGALAPAELERAQGAARKVENLWREDPTRLGTRRANLQQVQAPIEYDDFFLDLMEHPRVFPLVRELLGNDVSMIDNDLFISPPRTSTHINWHHDIGMPGVYHPQSTLMVKVFFLLEDVVPGGGGTLFLPGSHRFAMDFPLPKVENPRDMPGHVEMAFQAGTAYLFTGRLYHAASNNDSSNPRRALIYNYGHHWMRIWPGYEPSERLLANAQTPVRKQLLGMGPAYMTSLRDDE